MGDKQSMRDTIAVYHPRPYSIEARAGLPLAAGALVALGVLAIAGPWSLLTLGETRNLGDLAGAILQRLGVTVLIALTAGGLMVIAQAFLAARPDVAQYITPVDLDHDNQVDADEQAATEYLFTEAGLVEFANRVFFGSQAWTIRDLVPETLSREMYDLLIGNIYREMGILGDAPPRHSPNLLVSSIQEAAEAIHNYLEQKHRKYWSVDIKGVGGVVIRVRM